MRVKGLQVAIATAGATRIRTVSNTMSKRNRSYRSVLQYHSHPRGQRMGTQIDAALVLALIAELEAIGDDVEKFHAFVNAKS